MNENLGTWESWLENKIKEVQSNKWLTFKEKESIINGLKSLPANLRADFRAYALNMYGKTKELKPNEIRTVLDVVMKSSWQIFKNEIPREVFLDLIRKVFKKEIGIMKGGAVE